MLSQASAITGIAPGKALLIDAAVRLASKTRNFIRRSTRKSLDVGFLCRAAAPRHS